MTEDERVLKEKASVEAMRNAKANMTDALARIETLERALMNASSALKAAKDWISPSAYPYQSTETCHERINKATSSINGVL